MGRKQAQAILAAAIAWPGLAQDYTPTPIPNQIIGSPETMTPLNGGDDSTRLVQLGFSFEYFGQTFTQAWVSSNGFVSFGDIGHLCCDGWPIENAPRNTIYGLWTDLISNGNPYFRTNANEAIFGWYNTQEFGSWQPNTFEIALFPDGKVQWNYGDVSNVYHTITAGLTGPTMADSISIFYGQNVNLLDNTSYVALDSPPPPPPPPPEPEPEPQPEPEPEPEPPFTPVDAAPSVIESPIAQQEQVEEQEAEQAVQQVIEEQAEETPVETTTEEIEPEEEEAAQEVAVEAEEATDERLDPNQLEELAASPAQMDEQAVSEAVEAIADEAAAAEAAKVEAANSSSNQTDADVARADAPQLVQIEEAKIEAASDQQEMREMSAQQEAAQADAMTNQSSQQDGVSSLAIEEQSSFEATAPQRVEVALETPGTIQPQAIENTAFSASQQEQTTIVAEQTLVEIQQMPQQTEQAKEPERVTDKLISDVLTQAEPVKIDAPEPTQTIQTDKPDYPAEYKEPERETIIASLEGYQDINTAFFNKEAIEDADTFQRERVIPVSVQDVGIVASANAELAQTIGEQTTTETPAGTYDILIVDGPTFMPTPTTGMGDMTSPVNQAQQMELLGMNGMQTEMASGQPSDIGDINSGDKEAMTQLAALPPGYSGYTQLRLPDAPFYEPRDIYRGRRIPDANMALYRMMSGQDAKWAEMVGDQYE